MNTAKHKQGYRKTPHTCPVCKKSFLPKASRQRCCSRDCANQRRLTVLTTGKKECTTCHQEKPVSQFFTVTTKAGNKVPDSYCKLCKQERSKQWKTNNRETMSASSKRYREQNKDKLRLQYLKYRMKNYDKVVAKERGRYRKGRDNLSIPYVKKLIASHCHLSAKEIPNELALAWAEVVRARRILKQGDTNGKHQRA